MSLEVNFPNFGSKEMLIITPEVHNQGPGNERIFAPPAEVIGPSPLMTLY